MTTPETPSPTQAPLTPGLRWLLWALRHWGQRWTPAEKLVTYKKSGQLY
ncbi:hypothetical protein [Hydrogenophaga sp.]